MISSWSSYRLSDLILFSKEVYWATVENYNESIWPVQIIWLFVSMILLYSLYRGGETWGRVGSGIIALAWLWVGLVFHYENFLPINWAAEAFAWLFVFEAVMIIVVGGVLGHFQFQQKSKALRGLGITLLLLSLFVPLELLWGQQLSEVLLFGWGADRTAIGTIGVLLLCRFSWAQALTMIPALLWCLIASLMYYGFELRP